MSFAECGGVLRCISFDRFEWQTHGFGGRRANPAANVTLRQIHSTLVHTADGLADREAQGDALITSRIGLSIGVRTADCVPLLLLDARKRAVAAVHAGWRGTAARIAEHTVARMVSEYGSEPADMYVAIGPCIRVCCYEVSDDVAQQFEYWRGGVQMVASGKAHVDLARANQAQLLDAGVPVAHTFDCGLCTACLRERFFSYRREPGNDGRMLSVIERMA